MIGLFQDQKIAQLGFGMSIMVHAKGLSVIISNVLLKFFGVEEMKFIVALKIKESFVLTQVETT